MASTNLDLWFILIPWFSHSANRRSYKRREVFIDYSIFGIAGGLLAFGIRSTDPYDLTAPLLCPLDLAGDPAPYVSLTSWDPTDTTSFYWAIILYLVPACWDLTDNLLCDIDLIEPLYYGSALEITDLYFDTLRPPGLATSFKYLPYLPFFFSIPM